MEDERCKLKFVKLNRNDRQNNSSQQNRVVTKLSLLPFEYNQYTRDFLRSFLYLVAADAFLFLLSQPPSASKNHSCTKLYLPFLSLLFRLFPISDPELSRFGLKEYGSSSAITCINHKESGVL